MKNILPNIVCIVTILAGSLQGQAQSHYSQMAYGFEHPQDSTRTKVWWFHGETETTRTGITADLEAHRQQGVGGVVYYDQVHEKHTAGKALPAFSQSWWDALVFASQEAKRLGLTFEAHVSNGYVAGGPWITPPLAMQRLAVADTVVRGGRTLRTRLPLPRTSGYYKEVAVLAVPLNNRWSDSRRTMPVMTSSLKDLPVKDCFTADGKLVTIPAQEKGHSVFLTLDFKRPFTARSLQYELGGRGKATTSATNVPGPPSDTFVGTGYRVLPFAGQLEASDDGVHYTPVCNLLPLYRAHSNWRQKTVAFPAVTARYFRLNLHDWYEEEEANRTLRIGNILLSGRACVDQWEEKAGLYSEYITGDHTPSYSKAEIIDSQSIIDLTDLLHEGELRWNAPQGQWLILRFASVPTGVKTKHGRPNLSGLECDKLSAAAARIQWNHYFRPIMDSIRQHGGTISGMAMDSHEAGSQNWTPAMEKEFKLLRGYEMRHYLPVMAGYVVDSKEHSDGFLYDLRRTIADLLSYRHYGTLQALCDSAQVDFTAQAVGNALCIVGDEIQAKGQVCKPQGEFWAIHPDGNYDIKESSSAAHLYGKPIASAEAFTDARYDEPLSYLKSLADAAYSYGINEFVVCASAYQPWTDKAPGNTAGGRQYCLNRNNTFWPYSRGFWDYQSRCAYLLRQGRPVTDLCIYLGDNAPVKILTYRLPDIPKGFDFDACTTDALSRMDSLSYRMLVLPGHRELTLKALHKIVELVQKGANVYGACPLHTGSYLTKTEQEEYEALLRKLWDKSAEQGCRTYGAGKVYWGMSLSEALAQAGIGCDIALPESRKCYFTHRNNEGDDIYFLVNHEDTPLVHTFAFRSNKRYAEWWNPVTGERHHIAAIPQKEGTLSLPVEMAARESCFIILTDSCHTELPWKQKGKIIKTESLATDWEVSFDKKKGGPGTVRFPELMDWTTSTNDKVKFYSGTALYKKSFTAKRTKKDERVFLCFDRLGSIACVRLNGHEAGTVWCAPWEIEVTSYFKPGENHLEIEVTNTLMNRMIGDSSLPEQERITFATTALATPDTPLTPSGIIGDLKLVYRKYESSFPY